MEDCVIVHHGIKGMRWGKRNGPPYPLGASQKSSAEKHAEQKNRDAKSKSSVDNRFWTESRKATAKKVAKGAAITAAVVLAAYGGYKLSNVSRSKTSAIGKDFIHGFTSGKTINDIGGSSRPRVGKTADQINREMVSRINSGNIGIEGSINCTHCSMTYILNTLFGRTASAKGFNGVDELSGHVSSGRDARIFDVAFKGVKHRKTPSNETLATTMERIPRDSTGVILLEKVGPSGIFKHALNYERSSSGELTFIDSQRKALESQIISANAFLASGSASRTRILEILDFSDASIREGANNVFKYCVQGS